MASAPAYAATPKTPYVQISSANAGARDGAGASTLHTAGGSGGRAESALVVATGTTTAGMVRLFISNDAGSTKRMIAEIPVTAITPSATVQAFIARYPFPGGLILAASAVLYASTEKAETFNVILERCGDF